MRASSARPTQHRIRPDSFDGLLAWWDAEAEYVMAGAQVTAVRDQSGRGNHLDVVVGAGTVGRTAEDAAFNRRACFDMPAANSGLRTTNTFRFNDATLLVVFNDPAGTGSLERLLDHQFNTGWWVGRNSAAINEWGGGFIEPIAPYGQYGSFADGQTHMLGLRRTGTKHDVLKNGAEVLTKVGSNTQTGNQAISLGVSNGSLLATNAKIACAVIYERALNDTELLTLYDHFFKPRYGLP